MPVAIAMELRDGDAHVNYQSNCETGKRTWCSMELSDGDARNVILIVLVCAAQTAVPGNLIYIGETTWEKDYLSFTITVTFLLRFEKEAV